jgi:hypothetical protein
MAFGETLRSKNVPAARNPRRRGGITHPCIGFATWLLHTNMSGRIRMAGIWVETSRRFNHSAFSHYPSFSE